MELFDRYIDELETYLPKDLRDEVTEETRSTLAAKLESRQATETGRSDMDLAIEILKELGPPHALADPYVPRPRVLFRPRLYPPFMRTLKIAVAILVALAALGVALDFTRTQSFFALGESLISALGAVLTGSIVILGIAVVVFAIIERTAGASLKEDEEWDPRHLTGTDDPDMISLGDNVSSIAFLVVALIVVNFFSDRIGAHVSWNDESGWVPLLSRSFDLQLWILNLALGLDLLVNFIVLLRWRWSLTLRFANFGVNCLYVFWLGRLAAGPVILAADPDWMVKNGWSPEAAAEYQEFLSSNFAEVVDRGVSLVFVVACVGLAFSLFKLFRRMIIRS